MEIIIALMNCQLFLVICCLIRIGSELEKIRKIKEDQK